MPLLRRARSTCLPWNGVVSSRERTARLPPPVRHSSLQVAPSKSSATSSLGHRGSPPSPLPLLLLPPPLLLPPLLLPPLLLLPPSGGSIPSNLAHDAASATTTRRESRTLEGYPFS